MHKIFTSLAACIQCVHATHIIKESENKDRPLKRSHLYVSLPNIPHSLL